MATNVVELGARATIQRQARKWLIRLDGDEPLTDAEMKALREWLSCSASHREDLVRLSRFWSHASILTELIGGVEARRRGRRGFESGRLTIGLSGSSLTRDVELDWSCGDITRAKGPEASVRLWRRTYTGA